MKRLIVPFGVLLYTLFSLSGCRTQNVEPRALIPSPTDKQLEWFDMEYYGFIHFGPNTFTGNEWGHGDENPNVFCPSEMNTDQWARICKQAGMKGIVLTAKHHDGFCLWPSNYSTHTVRESKWMDGKGDVVKALSESCRKYGLKMGVYLSPWDMNHPDFTTKKYNDVYVNTIKEVLSNYGDMFEFWYDGGDTGKNGKKQIYDWNRFDKTIRECQPNIVINGCRDFRWVGNEAGVAPVTCWATVNMDSLEKAEAKRDGSILPLYGTGMEDGECWAPAECDVSIRPGWFHRSSEDDRVKSVSELFEIYMKSIGRNSTLILNIPPDQRGLIPAEEEKRLIQLKRHLDECFRTDLASKAKVSATNTRKGTLFSAKNVLKPTGYWATDDYVTDASLVFEWKTPQKINAVSIQEYIKLGQRIRKFSVEVFVHGKWQQMADGTTVGRKRIVRFDNEVFTDRLRINIKDAKTAITVSKVGIYKFPSLIVEPKLHRSSDGIVSIKNEMPFGEIRYTTDGSEPTRQSILYVGSFLLKEAATVKYMWIAPEENRQSIVLTQKFEELKHSWRALGLDDSMRKAFDGDSTTYWVAKANGHPYQIVVDMGEEKLMKGFSYLPRQDGSKEGNISEYSLYVSCDKKQWIPIVSHGIFANIVNNPILQKVYFKNLVKARFLKFVTHKDNHSLEDTSSLGMATVAEIDIITQ